MKFEQAKKNAACKAAELITDDCVVGLGTGTTAFYFIAALIDRCKKGLKIRAISSSQASATQAQAGGIELIDFDTISSIDITVDSADEIDPQKRMIKGKGGAHVREKILAAASNEMIVIADESKLVSVLGSTKLPIEILSYGSNITRRKITNLGFSGDWRKNADETFFISENGNFILDVGLPPPPCDLEKEHLKIIQIPGVIDTGFFFDLAGRVIIGYLDETVKIVK